MEARSPGVLAFFSSGAMERQAGRGRRRCSRSSRTAGAEERESVEGRAGSVDKTAGDLGRSGSRLSDVRRSMLDRGGGGGGDAMRGKCSGATYVEAGRECGAGTSRTKEAERGGGRTVKSLGDSAG